MTKDISIHIDSTNQREDIPNEQFQYCPKCGTECEQGFGLAGGGFGVYSYCSICETIVGKIQVEE